MVALHRGDGHKPPVAPGLPRCLVNVFVPRGALAWQMGALCTLTLRPRQARPPTFHCRPLTKSASVSRFSLCLPPESTYCWPCPRCVHVAGRPGGFSL